MKISVTKRKESENIKKLLQDGVIPAAMYGPKRESISIAMDATDFEKLFSRVRYSQLFDVEVEGEKKPVKALIREVQRNPVNDEFRHVSLYELDLEKPITADIPVVTKGDSKAVEDKIGFLVTPLETLEVRCLPQDLPSELVIDITPLKAIGDSLSVNDLDIPEGVELVEDLGESTTLAYIAPPQKEVVEEEPVVAVEEGEAAEEGEEGAVAEGEVGEEDRGSQEDGHQADGAGEDQSQKD